jgi:hypothetical protein
MPGRQAGRETLKQFLPIFRTHLTALIVFHDPSAYLPICRGQNRVDRSRGTASRLLKQPRDIGNQLPIIDRQCRDPGLTFGHLFSHRSSLIMFAMHSNPVYSSHRASRLGDTIPALIKMETQVKELAMGEIRRFTPQTFA